MAVATIGALLPIARQGKPAHSGVATASAASVPTFAQAREAQRYQEAVTEGERRAVQVLEDALRTTKAQPAPDPTQVEFFERELAKRRRE